MIFRCTIPPSKRAFDLPGSRGDLRVSFDIPESEMEQGIPLILLRGKLFKIEIFKLQFSEIEKDKPQVETKLSVIETWSSIAPKSSAIRIDGREDGMSVTLSFPTISENLFAKFLRLREEPLLVEIDEETVKEVL